MQSTSQRFLLLTGILTGALLVGSFVVDAVLDEQLLDELSQSRVHIEKVTSIRRDARKIYVGLLERTLAPPSEWAPRGIELRDRVVDLEARVRGFAQREKREFSGEAAHIEELVAATAVYREKTLALIDDPDAALGLLSLEPYIDRVDLVCEQLLSLNSFLGEKGDRRAADLQRYRTLLHLGLFFAVLSVLFVSALWYRQKERVEAQFLASELARQELRRMAASLAHEVNNQIGVMQNTIGLLRKSNSEHAALLQFQQESVDQMQKLTGDFLAFSSPSRTDREPLNLAELVETLSRGLTAPVEVVAEPCYVEGSRLALSGALLNVLKNAVEAGGPVRVEVRSEAGFARVRVLDQGPGVDAAVADKLGQPFVTTKARGTGLGLAVVLQAVGDHGGKFALRNREGGGAVAELSLPATKLRPGGSLRPLPSPSAT